MNAAPYSCCSHAGSSHLMPNSKGTTAGVATSVFTPLRYRPSPNRAVVRVPFVESDPGDSVEPHVRAGRLLRRRSGRRTTRCRTVRPRSGSGRGRARGPRASSTTPTLLAEGDRRNVVDRYRYWTVEAIVADLDRRRHPFHIAIENWQHDFNIGTIVRSANAFLAQEVHIVGNRRWNRRGAMVTDRYQHVRHHPTVADLHDYLAEQADGPVPLLGIDNLPGSAHLETMEIPRRVCFLFGQEGPGLSAAARAACDATFSIAQFGSTRSINASAAAAIAMHAWVRTHADLTDETAWRGSSEPE